MIMKKIFSIFILFILAMQSGYSQNLRQLWESPPEESKSWVIWYWMHGAITKEGITADLEAMSEAGIGGAYLMTIRGVPEKPFLTPVVEQLSPLWWEMVDFAFKEADRVGVKIGFHICDGFALAGGPWITPELSMQKVVWTQTNVKGGKAIKEELSKPESYRYYYKDIAVFAYPTPDGQGISTENVKPKITNSLGIDAQFLADKNSDEIFRSEDPCWIQYEFEKPFTCRTIQVQMPPRSFQGQRLTIEASQDGTNFRKIVQIEPPRQGWQNEDQRMTSSIPPTTAKYFRFLYNKSGTEPGAEDLDAAKWKQNLKIKGIWLSSEARIHQYEGKNGSMWRISPRTTIEQIPQKLCIDPKKLIDVTKYMDDNGVLNWMAPRGNWTIIRMGHTSTGHTNATGGGGTGLECDKFNPEAIRLQFNSWFGKAYELAGKDIASRVLKVFHIDSWECGSQNWSITFREEFKNRRGYDIYDYLPVMAGIPIESVEKSEQILYDVRKTISELVADKFYAVLEEEAHAKGCQFSAESVAPTMMSDGMLHYKNVDIPMNEYWLQSPTHDKPNDVLDAISGAHVYGKNIIQAEAFTQLRLMFDEHPAMLKTLQDRQYALGINRLSYHVNALNPWLDRKPGMTLDGIGLYFQRDQTWWKSGKAWVDYAQRCQALLQYGKPVIDIAVFTGEEFPRRSMLPDRLVPFLPGLFGEEKLEWEKTRLANVGEPTKVMPVGVNHSANITGAEDWVNCLRGYHYDSFNADALLNLAKVKDGCIVLPDGMSYSVLVVPGKHPMQPNPECMSNEVKQKIEELRSQGAIILYGNQLPYKEENLDKLGVERDLIVYDKNASTYAKDIAFAHRKGNEADIYFISNQKDELRNLKFTFRISGKSAEIWDPVSGKIKEYIYSQSLGNKTEISLTLDANQSVFVVFEKEIEMWSQDELKPAPTSITINTPWTVQFDNEMRGPKDAVIFNSLTDWSLHDNDSIKYYSGTAIYKNTFNIEVKKGTDFYIQLDEIANLAEVKINGKSCGTLWTKPYKLDITNAVKDGENTIEIEVTNTWANRIMGDEDFGAEKDDSKKTWTNGKYHRMKEKKLVKSGLIGKVEIVKN
ncbi:glycosyl hydrolase [Dysgonomonas sp. 520]|uniref:glycosyl hydrolase n=1 Tax=Dysgonomonas sp. 520 TaxID=2302931 RepID=UPI0013D7FC62|nr:glycosyl hydrolase [Dysgonomonas sp. 520]NDW09714.1 DNA-binding protein [Dysgonomonas sp. 520]